MLTSVTKKWIKNCGKNNSELTILIHYSIFSYFGVVHIKGWKILLENHWSNDIICQFRQKKKESIVDNAGKPVSKYIPFILFEYLLRRGLKGHMLTFKSAIAAKLIQLQAHLVWG